MEVWVGLPPALSSLQEGPFGTPCSGDQLSRGLGLPSCVTECAERRGRGAWPAALEAGSVVADGGLRVMDRSSPADLMCLLAGFLILIIRSCGAPALFSASAHIPIPVPPSPVGRWVESHSSPSFPSGSVGGIPFQSPLPQWVGGWNPIPVPPFPVGWWVEPHPRLPFASGSVGGIRSGPAENSLCSFLGPRGLSMRSTGQS